MAAKYTLKRTSDNQFMFNLVAPNGGIILTSERYTAKASAENGIRSTRENSPHDERYQRLTATDGSPYFVLRAANHEIVGRSERYSSTQAMETGIAAVKRYGPSAEVDDQTPAGTSAHQ